MRFAVLIAENVIGKSKCMPGYKRVKPIKYRHSDKEHPILYYKLFAAKSKQKALAIAKEEFLKMLQFYSLLLASNTFKIISYTVVLHLFYNDSSYTIGGTEPSIKDKSGCLFDYTYPKYQISNDGPYRYIEYSTSEFLNSVGISKLQ